jgi:hypothetical protein
MFTLNKYCIPFTKMSTMKTDHTKISKSRVRRGLLDAPAFGVPEPNSDDDDWDESDPRPPIPKDENSK